MRTLLVASMLLLTAGCVYYPDTYGSYYPSSAYPGYYSSPYGYGNPRVNLFFSSRGHGHASPYYSRGHSHSKSFSPGHHRYGKGYFGKGHGRGGRGHRR